MVTQVDNDTRGWIMSIVSGVACTIGASIICVDIIIRYIPSKSHFSIQDSDVFLAASLSLSFGVMIFSALYSMLPSSKTYLRQSGLSASAAAWILLACFVAGFMGIQVVSRILHHYIPSHVVDCDHHHDDGSDAHSHYTARSRSHTRRGSIRHSHGSRSHMDGHKLTDSTPLLRAENGHHERQRSKSLRHTSSRDDGAAFHMGGPRRQTTRLERRPSMVRVQNRVLSFVKDTKSNCDESGPCFGYSDPCGQECYRHIATRTGSLSRPSTLIRTMTGSHSLVQTSSVPEEDPDVNNEASSTVAVISPRIGHSEIHEQPGCESPDEDLEAQHHHHVPENAFMSIGLQTSIAIALHKLPEGFITYATNHANPSLGFAVFMALFIHNITEGFAMALPLYLALGSRPRAISWSALLGGVSQPLGAGIAALWFKVARHTDQAPGFRVYGCMFAITAGIMTSVALSLFTESLSLNHNRNLCVAFAFIGMAILGISNGLTAE